MLVGLSVAQLLALITAAAIAGAVIAYSLMTGQVGSPM